MGLRKTRDTTPAGDERRSNERNYDALLLQFASGEAKERRWAARDLAHFPQASQALIDALTDEKDFDMVESIFNALQKMPSETTVIGLIQFLQSDEALIRNNAIEVLQHMPELVSRYVDQLLNDHDSDVRIFALDILQQLAHRAAPVWLNRVLTEEDHVNVISTAVDRCMELGDDTLIPALEAIKVRFPDEDYLHFAVDSVLERLASAV